MELQGGRTTKFETIVNTGEPKLVGDEKYPLLGSAITLDQSFEIQRRLVGMKRYWDCIDKARIARAVLGKGVIAFGACLVWSRDMLSSYGYYWNPPHELHSWVFLQETMEIVDVALPGVIELGLKTADEIGPIIKGRVPVILAGPPPEWIQYRGVQFMSEIDGRQYGKKI